MHVVTKSCMGKDLFKVRDGSMDFNVMKCEKFADMVSDSTLQLTLNKLPFVGFWSSVE